ncbi:MAG TPA: tRNA-uridine aminocarboxypropyltransferase [Bacteriovoracaceae bacterium]|nr:tRNA-uridine aminocarboxypropyltransferase [Bacteriovoracaceae bacterium]
MNFDRKRKTKDPCEGCSLHKERCICAYIPRLNLKTKVTLVVHAKELKRTTNSGTLALKALSNSEIKIRGKDQTALDLSTNLTSEYRTFLYYPSENAVELNEKLISESTLPIQLIVPDGNWRQASKVHYRHHELLNVPRVMISTPNLAEHHLRAENTEYGMSTLQAIALALGVIEGPEVQEKMMLLYQKKLEQTLIGRGIATN